MNTDFERKQSLFEAARKLTDPAQRRAFLETRCDGDLVLLAQMEKLLWAGEQAEEFFADCVPMPATISAVLESGGIFASEESGEALFDGIRTYRFLLPPEGSHQ
jgi:hypothetical protein